MSEREEVKLQFASDDYEHMVDEIVRLRSQVKEQELQADIFEEVIRRFDVEVTALRSQLAAMQRECEEQARLNGMGSEREAKLLAQLTTAERERDEARRERDDAIIEKRLSDEQRAKWIAENVILVTRAERAERVVEAIKNPSDEMLEEIKRDMEGAWPLATINIPSSWYATALETVVEFLERKA